MVAIHKQAQPFFLKGDKGVALLFIHGFTASPSELRPVAELLHKYCGCSIEALLLPGHGSSPEDLNRYHWRDWFAAVKKELMSLQGQYPRVFVAGLSLGGLLALYTGIRVPGVSGAASINAPIFQRSGWKTALLPLIAKFQPYWTKNGQEEQKRLEGKGRFAYNYFPLQAFQSMMELRSQLLREINDLRIPALIMQSLNDEVVKPKSGSYLFRQLNQGGARLVELENSWHVATMSADKEKIAQELAEFVKSH